MDKELVDCNCKKVSAFEYALLVLSLACTHDLSEMTEVE